jgi:hypothetical protein
MMVRRRAGWLLILIGALPLAGCYTYLPTTLDAAPRGARIRALLSEEAERRLADYGMHQGRTLSGEIQGRRGDQVVVLALSVPMGAGGGMRPLYQEVVLAPGDVLRVDQRRLDPVRTGMLAAAAAAATGVLAWQALFGSGEATPPPPGGGPAEQVRPWGIRLPMPRP